MKKTLKNLIVCLLLLRGGILTAQTTLQVVTKTIEKTLPCPVGMAFNLDAEKADITLRTDPQSREIKVKIELMARHPQLEVAKKDIAAMKAVTETIGKKIYIRNYIAVEKGAAKPTADLRARYSVSVPPDLFITLKNTFGKLSASDLTNKLDITAEFCKIHLQNINAQTILNTRFGDLEAIQLDGKTTISSHRTDMDLKFLKGACVVHAQFGKIHINADKTLSLLSVTAEKTDIVFDPPDDAARFGYNLNAEYGTVKTPPKLNFTYPEKSKQRERAQLTGKTVAAMVNIQTSFGQITIEQ
jgi:Putative adhesin